MRFCRIYSTAVIKVAYSISGDARKRELGNLAKLAQVDDAITRFVVVTKDEEETIEHEGTQIEVIPAWKFLLTLPE